MSLIRSGGFEVMDLVVAVVTTMVLMALSTGCGEADASLDGDMNTTSEALESRETAGLERSPALASSGGTNVSSTALFMDGGRTGSETVEPDEEGEEVLYCRGIQRTHCPVGMVCVDYRADTCFPHAGDDDCLGICVSR